ncbi:hypothetical protein QQX13_07655 [Demequina sp. SYSU T00068]|uniref:nucleotidyltransferase domain-containing protein n=1 Tax=Demequina lignilytica TaxID=3051663 RepID=UPI00261687A9|nr:hypothetical protein [Demequina sp. SYSU T00068]MDN4490706.1 hypothetical protein [Demequina sp. SYSU T00068]
MSPTTPPATPWAPLTPEAVSDLLASTDARWWLSGGVALDRWMGERIRERENIDVSTVPADLPALVAALPASFTAWATVDDALVPYAEVPEDADVQPVLVRDDDAGAWVLRVNVEDGAPRAWLYRRDARLQLPWERAVLDVDGIPTGAPEVQLLWKCFSVRPEDDVDKDAVMPHLSEEARAWWEKALLRIHPHSSWTIPVRSPMFPARASWNRPQR